MTIEPRCPSRITHEDGAVRRCMWAPHDDEQLHMAGNLWWSDDNDRVIVDDPPATVLRAGTPAAVVSAGQRVTVVETDGTTHTGIVDSVETDGSFTFSQQPTSPVVEKWFDIDQPANADTAVEQLEVHHARGKQRTGAEEAALNRREGACCQAAYDSDGFAHDHGPERRFSSDGRAELVEGQWRHLSSGHAIDLPPDEPGQLSPFDEHIHVSYGPSGAEVEL